MDLLGNDGPKLFEFRVCTVKALDLGTTAAVALGSSPVPAKGLRSCQCCTASKSLRSSRLLTPCSCSASSRALPRITTHTISLLALFQRSGFVQSGCMLLRTHALAIILIGRGGCRDSALNNPTERRFPTLRLQVLLREPSTALAALRGPKIISVDTSQSRLPLAIFEA